MSRNGPRRLRVSPPESAAAGLKAVEISTAFALGEMGPVRTPRVLGQLNQTDGFDCPGCAWPEAEHRSVAEFCENGAKAAAWEATTKTVDAAFFARHSVADLQQRGDHWLEAQGRLTSPMQLQPGATHYTPVSWADALSTLGGALRELPDPNRAVFYTSGRTSNEAAFLYQLFARRLGTNNLPDCSNMCHESSGVAMNRAIGIGKGTVTLEDITDHAELVLVVGQNPGTNHPRMLSALEKVKERGGRIIAINPLPEAGLIRFKNPQKARGVLGRGSPIADLHLPVALGGDQALFAPLINRALVQREDATPGAVLDHHFIDNHTAGIGAAQDYWRGLDVEATLAQTGLTVGDIERVVEETVRASSIVVCWAMGITQHRNGVATIEEILNYLLLRGNLGKPGAGACPVRGHSNVQGDRTMGIFEQMPEGFLSTLDTEFGIVAPREPGFDAVNAIRAMRDGKVDVFVGMGGNFAGATPDTDVTHRALRSTELTVHVSTKLNRSHLVHGRQALILPCLGRSDLDVQNGERQMVTVEDSMGVVHGSRGRVQPGSAEMRSEVAIICELAQATFPGDSIPWGQFAADYGSIRERIGRVVPGFADFNERLRAPGGFTLPNPPRDERRFDTPTGRAHFRTADLRPWRLAPGQLLLQTLRSHDQYNTTIYGMDDRYRGIHGGRMVVLVNPDDLAALGIEDGDLVDLTSIWSDGERTAPGFRVVSYPTPRGCAAAYYPETNVLVPLDSTAAESNTPTSKSIVIRLGKR